MAISLPMTLHLSQIMRLTIAVFVFLILRLSVTSRIHAERFNSTATTSGTVTRKDGRIHVVLGRATPSSADRGSVTFSIITDDDGKLVFNTSNHFETKPKQ